MRRSRKRSDGRRQVEIGQERSTRIEARAHVEMTGLGGDDGHMGGLRRK